MVNTPSSGRRFVVVDHVEPRDSDARCDGCGTQGTIARTVRHSTPPAAYRYCEACWPEALGALDARREAEHRRWAEEWRAWEAARVRAPGAAPPPPNEPPSWSTTSRSWHDVRRFLRRFVPWGGRWPLPTDVGDVVAYVRRRAPYLDGSMPPDIAAFLAELEPPAA